MSRPKTQSEWNRFCEINPPREGEHRFQWMARLLEMADGERAKPEPARLPYRDDAREPGGDD